MFCRRGTPFLANSCWINHAVCVCVCVRLRSREAVVIKFHVLYAFPIALLDSEGGRRW